MHSLIIQVCSKIGLRDENEDQHQRIINLADSGKPIDPNRPPVDLFMICDGHGGAGVASFVCSRLPQKLLTNDRYCKFPIDIERVYSTFQWMQDCIRNDKNNIGAKCGATCITVIRYLSKKQERIQVINLGDSRCVLSRGGRAIPLSIDHKPSWPNEESRILDIYRENSEESEDEAKDEDNDGSDDENKDINEGKKIGPITYYNNEWRVGEGMSVSRAFGDLDSAPYISCLPDSIDECIQEDDRFLIIACDGLWDVVQNHEAVNFVQDHINDFENNKYAIRGAYPDNKSRRSKTIASKLANYAIAKGSTDNITVFVIIFN